MKEVIDTSYCQEIDTQFGPGTIGVASKQGKVKVQLIHTSGDLKTLHTKRSDVQ